jgi:hypothetical protein
MMSRQCHACVIEHTPKRRFFCEPCALNMTSSLVDELHGAAHLGLDWMEHIEDKIQKGYLKGEALKEWRKSKEIIKKAVKMYREKKGE